MVVGPLLLLASLLSAEAGVATMAYIVPHALFLDRGPVRRRLLSLAPYVCVVIAWRVVWAALGYGVHGAGAYVDPAASPLRFAGALIEVGPVLLLAQWAFPPSDLYALYDAFWPGTARLVWLAAVAFLTLIAFVLAKRLRRERETAFWTSGMLLALAPVCATVDFPMDRLLLFVGLGACGLLANFLAAVWSARRATAAGTARPRLWTASLALAVFFVLVHLVVSPVALVVRAAAPAGPHEFTSQFYVSLPDDVVRGADTIVVVNAPSGGMVTMFPVMQAATGKPVPQRMRMLGPSLSALTITREGDRTLRIRPDDGFMAWTYDRLVRGLDHPFTAGERVELAGMHVQVTDITGDGRPAEALFVFDVELDHAALLWLQWRDGRFVPFTLPATGETVRIPRAKPHFGF
jgi:hypothetical protein